ncbi:hypothetical protein [Sphingomonas sp.]|uniref:hypothetical protein n=1 Tax=Sphingomonas sp. TaxID=28214 RepID=UPI0031DCCA9C
MRLFRISIGVMGLMAMTMAANAQEVRLPAPFVPGQAVGYGSVGGPWQPVTPATPMPVISQQESFQLVSANTPMGLATLAGGAYVLTQACQTYGSVAIRYRGPDGVTMTTMLTKTAADTMGGTVLSFGSGSVVDAALSGTTGCNIVLARIPQ